MHDHKPRESNFRFAFWINLIFSLIELVGGFFFGSLAILSDALHDFSDSVSLGLGWYFEKLSKKSGDNKFSYGYRRFSILGAVINSTILIMGSIFILYHAVLEIMNPGETNSLGMMGLAVLGIVVNFWAYRKMHTGQSLNEQVVSLHLLEDVLGWVAVLIGGALIYFFGWQWIDPLLSIGITLFIGTKAIKRLIHCFKLLLQGVPDEIDLEIVKRDLNNINGVSSINDLHIWSMDGELYIMTLHVTLVGEPNWQEQVDLKRQLRSKINHDQIKHITIELESPQERDNSSLAH